MRERAWVIFLIPLIFLIFGCGNDGRTTLTVAVVNNPDLQVMMRLTNEFEESYPNIRLNWVVLSENELRTRITSDVASRAGSYDVVTIGTYETPFWAANGWLESIDQLVDQFADSLLFDYDRDDLMPTVLAALSNDGQAYALPFYGESSMTFYNRELFEEAGLEMPSQPTWEEIRSLACQLHRPEHGQYGIVLRGLPGWGEMLAPLTTVVNTFGGRWFDESWEPQLTSPEWRRAVQFYVDLIQDCGAPGATTTGFTEALTLMSHGQVAIWVDATVAAGILFDDSDRDTPRFEFAYAPVGPVAAGNHWLWAWAFAIPNTSRNKMEAVQFINWATSQDYVALVGEQVGWTRLPPGTRISTYEHDAYIASAPFASIVRASIESADPENPTLRPVPYVGIQYAGIPEFQGIGTDVSQLIASAISGSITVDQALERGQEVARRSMAEAGYYDR